MFLLDTDNILAYTYNGAMHYWQKSVKDESETWTPKLTIKGHHGEVNDLDWDPNGHFLLTTSSDQTSRIFRTFNEDAGWFEISRPQVHGYDMNTISLVKIHST
jgi:elongator complex protein 2